MKKAIGGYFGLEMPIARDFFFVAEKNSNSVFLNTGRNALEYILTIKKVHKIYIPYFTCDVLLEPLEKLEINYEFYDVDDHLEPIFDFDVITDNDFFLYTNYFGIKTAFIKIELLPRVRNLIIDNAQALFANPIDTIFQFYSPRKFLGLADGGIVVGPDEMSTDFLRDVSYDRMSHLLKRIDLSAEEAYEDFKSNDDSLRNQPIKLMSSLSEEIFRSVDYKNIKHIRVENFKTLHASLGKINNLTINLSEDDVPMVYPFRSGTKNLRENLIRQRIYCAKYWPNVQTWCGENENSYWLTEEIIAIPIDQRYDINDMNHIIKHVESFN